MATNTTNFGFKKPDESDFYDVQDQNNNWDLADKALNDLDTPTFEDYTGDTTVPSAETALGNIKSKGKLATLLSNIKAFCKGCCTLAMIVNNCVTDNPNMPLSAAQGKALMDLYTKLNSDFLPLTGGTLTGDLSIQKFNNGKSYFYKSHTETVDQGTFIRDDDANGNIARLYLKANDELKKIIGVSLNGNSYYLFGEHNKPTGSYTGNGSATSRTINTGGIGNALLLQGNGYSMLVTSSGAFGLQYERAESVLLARSYINFNNGVLTIGSDSGVINSNGKTYYYQVL